MSVNTPQRLHTNAQMLQHRSPWTLLSPQSSKVEHKPVFYSCAAVLALENTEVYLFHTVAVIISFCDYCVASNSHVNIKIHQIAYTPRRRWLMASPCASMAQHVTGVSFERRENARKPAVLKTKLVQSASRVLLHNQHCLCLHHMQTLGRSWYSADTLNARSATYTRARFCCRASSGGKNHRKKAGRPGKIRLCEHSRGNTAYVCMLLIRNCLCFRTVRSESGNSSTTHTWHP